MNQKDDLGNPCRNFLSSDGEDIILRNAYKDDVITLFRETLIDYGRVGAGTTRIHNASDRQLTFRDAHSMVRKVQRSKIDVSDKVLTGNIKKAFDNLKSRYSTLTIGSGHVDNIIEGCLVLVYVYQKIHNPQQAKRAFMVCGQHCNADTNDGSTISFEKIMSQCYSDISKAQLDLMKSKAPYFVENYILKQGRVPYDVLIEHGFAPATETIDRDDLSAVRHNSEIISHHETLQRLREFHYVRSKEYLDKKKAESQAEKLILRDIKERQLAEEREEKALQKKKQQAEER
jgi:hypothetical protein